MATAFKVALGYSVGVPVLTLLLLFLVVGEPILPSTLIGLVLILGGLALQQCQKTPSPASHESN